MSCTITLPLGTCGLRIFEDSEMAAGAISKFYQVANFVDPEGYLYLQGQGLFGDVLVDFANDAAFATIRERIPLPNENALIQQLDAKKKGHKYFRLINASISPRFPKIYTWRYI